MTHSRSDFLAAGWQTPAVDIGGQFDNSLLQALPAMYQHCLPEPVTAPQWVYWNEALAKQLGLADTSSSDASLWSGNRAIHDAVPVAQYYAGHQFGHFNPQLGDGRALILGELITANGERRDLALKGSGRTPFSRGGDGKAALAPMLREVLISEAMHALGIASTRSLAVVASGEQVFRQQPEPGAILTRVASSHLRIGSFEYFARQGQWQQLQQLADYCIWRHGTDPQVSVLDFLQQYSVQQAGLIADWMAVGFIHGVMNTDNMSIAAETIDYGPCAFMEHYDPAAVFSSIDHQGRYAYGAQPAIAQWNLARFAECLLPLLAADKDQAIALAEQVVGDFTNHYQQQWLSRFRAKLGLDDSADSNTDRQLAEDFLQLLQRFHLDFTQSWYTLTELAEQSNLVWPDPTLQAEPSIQAWLGRWQARWQQQQGGLPLLERMRAANPWLIPRNHQVEQALENAAQAQDMRAFERLLRAVQQPFNVRPELADLTAPASEEFTRRYQTFCGT